VYHETVATKTAADDIELKIVICELNLLKIVARKKADLI